MKLQTQFHFSGYLHYTNNKLVAVTNWRLFHFENNILSFLNCLKEKRKIIEQVDFNFNGICKALSKMAENHEFTSNFIVLSPTLINIHGVTV